MPAGKFPRADIERQRARIEQSMEHDRQRLASLRRDIATIENYLLNDCERGWEKPLDALERIKAEVL